MEIEAIQSIQSSFFTEGQTRELSFRIASLKRLEQLIEDREEAILSALREDLGKPKMEAYLSEVYFIKQEIRLCFKKLATWARPQRVPSPFYHFPERAEVRREPFGQTLILAPWNYPFQLALAPLISSIAAGNTVLLKPSELAPATSQLLGQIIGDAFQPEHAAVLEGGIDTATQLLARKFDLIFFTGSERVGKIVASAAAKHLTPTVLELGGKCPVLVEPSADLNITAQRIVRTKFFNAGQTCLAPDYICAHESIADKLTQLITEQATELYGGNDSIEGDLAKVISDSHWDRLQALLSPDEKTVSIGEDIPAARLLSPKILPEASWNSNAMQEEIFGPILPILSYSDENELVEKVNRHPTPLALYLFSKNQSWVDRLAEKIPSGTLGINDIIKQGINLNLPLGGVGTSGMGRYRGKYGFDTFTYPRAVSRRWFSKDLFSIDPPYQGKFEKNRKLLK